MNTQGIGLGLVIADLIVAQFKGKIRFKSKENIGSTFTFNFVLEEIYDEDASCSNSQDELMLDKKSL